MRILLIAGLILFLIAVIYAYAVEIKLRDAHSNAAFRLIGEALQDGDVEAVQMAIGEYERQGSSPSIIVDVLSDRKSP